MPSEYSLDKKGKVKPKPQREQSERQKDDSHVPVEQIHNQPNPETLTHMQQTVGNAAVQRFLAQRSGAEAAELDDDTADTIHSHRGSGHNLDQNIAEKAGQTMGQDFSDVSVHTDQPADQLSQQLGAKAFTTGNDVFFRQGAYNPDSSDGQRLIAHELTHVAQQGASPPAVQKKMTVNDPNDQYEAEADSVADQVMTQPDNVQLEDGPRDIQMQEEEEEVQMQEEEEEVQMQEEEEEVQMQEEEEEVQMQEEEEEVQMQEEEEEVQMQEEEEEVQMQEEEEEVQMQER